MKKSRLQGILFGSLICFAGFSAQAITLHTSDFINNAARTNFNGFESIPNDGSHYTGGNGPYTEDGIQTEQINGDGASSIAVKFFGGNYEGSHSWYPDGADHGYTMITMSNGSDFNNIGFYVGTGGNPALILYDLLLDGNSVFSGATPFAGSFGDFNYIGFSGGGFDTVLVRDNNITGGSSFYDGGFNTLTLDAIETSAVPLPATFWLFGSGLLGIIGVLRRRKAA